MRLKVSFSFSCSISIPNFKPANAVNKCERIRFPRVKLLLKERVSNGLPSSTPIIGSPE